MKVTKAVILYSRLIKPRSPHIIIFYISEKDKVVRLEVYSVRSLGIDYKPNYLTRICSIYPVGKVKTHILTKFEGEDYGTKFEGSNANAYSLDNPIEMIKFNAGILFGQLLARKAFIDKSYRSSKEEYDVLYDDLINNFIKTRFTVRYIKNIFEVNRYYKIPRIVFEIEKKDRNNDRSC